MLYNLYQKLILKYPLSVLLVLVSTILIFGMNITKLEIDASAETLLLNDDKDLAHLQGPSPNALKQRMFLS